VIDEFKGKRGQREARSNLNEGAHLCQQVTARAQAEAAEFILN
jgi:hypothetical protein